MYILSFISFTSLLVASHMYNIFLYLSTKFQNEYICAYMHALIHISIKYIIIYYDFISYICFIFICLPFTKLHDILFLSNMQNRIVLFYITEIHMEQNCAILKQVLEFKFKFFPGVRLIIKKKGVRLISSIKPTKLLAVTHISFGYNTYLILS